ncbi:hypothetical protein DPMN_091287 [Dreissena polymorpha]|uniref:Uncharacterized protein n=1 Tax=Dreissena polymorpha TaxID=45954 RepID=A0A9D4KZA1_DREPO|nr:hypothetical protein DPMN_091287 [Dreissena polymorpha]
MTAAATTAAAITAAKLNGYSNFRNIIRSITKNPHKKQNLGDERLIEHREYKPLKTTYQNVHHFVGSCF